jgi:fused signal recognition particle receptor
MFGFKDKPSAPETTEPARRGLFARLRERLTKTRGGLTGGLAALFRGRQVDDELLEELETRLLMADVGIEATTQIIGDLTARVKRHQLDDGEALLGALREEMEAILAPVTRPLEVDATPDGTCVVLMVGVNGAGKTTTIGKLARRLQAEGRSVMLAAGDTFRAAAVEQLQNWGARHDVPVIAQQSGADSASVIFDALQAARARGADVLIADTAGRLHTQANLMEELKKVALVQARQFHAAVGLTGITLTKLDGTAKGGIVFAIARELGVPIRFIGIGEQAEDLRPFDGAEFTAALLDDDAA